IALGTDGVNYQMIAVDASGHLQADVLSGGGAGEQYPDNEPIGILKKGTIALGTDGTNYQILSTNSEGKLETVTEDIAYPVCQTTALLGANISFLHTCAYSDKGLSPFEKSKITGAVYANVDGTLYIKQVLVGGVFTAKTIPVIGGILKTFCFENVTGRINIQYLNGSVAQTTFSLNIWVQPSGVGFNVEDGKALVDVSNNAIRDNGKIDIAGIDVPLPSGSNNIGGVVVTSLPSTPAGNNNIGDVDIVTMPAVAITSLPATPAGTNLIGKVSASEDTSVIYNGVTPLTPKFAIINVSFIGQIPVVAGVVGKKIRLLQYVLVSTSANTIKWTDTVPTDKSGVMSLIANEGISSAYSPVGLLETGAGFSLCLDLTVASPVTGHLVYIEV
ncbi:MAG: hypothetical protein KKG50_08590, partial [Candidatus Omnitrophica bacterium]|nr:hypothetical protein [Candidatus Omnitrophota bacterium]